MRFIVQFFFQCWICYDSDSSGSSPDIKDNSDNSSGAPAINLSNHVTNQFFIETTLAMIKPDAVSAGNVDVIKQALIREGFFILKVGLVRLENKVLYLYGTTSTYMCSCTCEW